MTPPVTEKQPQQPSFLEPFSHCAFAVACVVCGALLLGLFHLTGGVLLAIVAWKFWPSLQQAWAFPARHFMGNPGFFMISQWPLFAIMLAGIATTAAQFLIMAAGDFRRAAGGAR